MIIATKHNNYKSMYRDKKINKYVVATAVLLAVATLVFCLISSLLYFAVLLAIAYTGYRIWDKIKQPLILLSVFLIIGCFVVLFFDQHVFKNFFSENDSRIEDFIPGFLVAIIILIFPFILLYKYYIKLTGLIKPVDADIAFTNRPHLICKEHLTRTETLILNDSRIKVKCRIGKYCGQEKKLTYAKYLIGVVGRNHIEGAFKGNYYVTLWDHKRQIFREGDYDFIEIYENKEIEDYNAVIAKIISSLYNSLKGSTPMHFIRVQIFGSIDLSKNTRRMLKKYFLNVEYESDQTKS